MARGYGRRFYGRVRYAFGQRQGKKFGLGMMAAVGAGGLLLATLHDGLRAKIKELVSPAPRAGVK